MQMAKVNHFTLLFPTLSYYLNFHSWKATFVSILQGDPLLLPLSAIPNVDLEYLWFFLLSCLFGLPSPCGSTCMQVMRPNHGEEYTIAERNSMEWTFDKTPRVRLGLSRCLHFCTIFGI